MFIQDPSPAEKLPERKAEHPPSATAGVKNVWSHASNLLYNFTWCIDRATIFHGSTTLVGHGLLLAEILRSHQDTPH